MQRYPSHSVLIGGDFNTDLDKASQVTQMLCSFFSEVNLTRCDRLFHGPYPSTYHNESLNHERHFAVNNPEAVLLFSVLDLNIINLSDHRPICVMCSFVFDHEVNIDDTNVVQSIALLIMSPSYGGIRLILNCIVT